MPGGHGTGEKPLRSQSQTDLWLGALGPPVFIAALLMTTFLGTPRGPAWRLWLFQAIVIGCIALYVWLGSLPRLRELRRRRRTPESGPPRRTRPKARRCAVSRARSFAAPGPLPGCGGDDDAKLRQSGTDSFQAPERNATVRETHLELNPVATLGVLFAFVFLIRLAAHKENPLAVSKPEAADAKEDEPKLDAAAKLDEVKSRNEAALAGVGAKMSHEEARGKLLKTLKGPNDRLPFPTPEPPAPAAKKDDKKDEKPDGKKDAGKNP